MNRLTAAVRMHLRKPNIWFLVPLIVLMSSFIINLIIGASVPLEEGIYTGGVASIVIYMLVMGIVSFVQTFPYALGMGIRRTDYYWGTMISALVSIGFFALFMFVMSIAEGKWTNFWGVDLHFFELPYWSDGPIINRLWIPFALIANQFVLGFLIASYYRLLGKVGLFVLTIILLVVSSAVVIIFNFYGVWADLFHWSADKTMADLMLGSLPFTIAFALLSYIIIRKCK